MKQAFPTHSGCWLVQTNCDELVTHHTTENLHILSSNFINLCNTTGLKLRKIDRFTNQSLPNITDFIACEIKLDRGEKLLFCSVYRSPNSTKEYSKQINDTMRQLCDQGQIYRHIIFVGDYNYPMIDWETGTRPQAAHLKTLIFYFLKQLETVS